MSGTSSPVALPFLPCSLLSQGHLPSSLPCPSRSLSPPAPGPAASLSPSFLCMPCLISLFSLSLLFFLSLFFFFLFHCSVLSVCCCQSPFFFSLLSYLSICLSILFPHCYGLTSDLASLLFLFSLFFPQRCFFFFIFLSLSPSARLSLPSSLVLFASPLLLSFLDHSSLFYPPFLLSPSVHLILLRLSRPSFLPTFIPFFFAVPFLFSSPFPYILPFCLVSFTYSFSLFSISS